MEESTEQQQLAAAMKAVRHVLRRIAEDPEVACLMGHCTVSYDLLCQAVAVHEGRKPSAVADIYPPATQPAPQTVVGTRRGTMDDTQASVCEVLSVAPFIAAAVIARAQRRGHPLPRPRRDPEDAQIDPHFADFCERAWVDWAYAAGRRGAQIH